MERASKEERRASRPSKEERRASRGTKEQRRASKGLDGYVAMRIANISSADWKTTSQERRAEFLKAAKRAIAGIDRWAKG